MSEHDENCENPYYAEHQPDQERLSKEAREIAEAWSIIPPDSDAAVGAHPHLLFLAQQYLVVARQLTEAEREIEQFHEDATYTARMVEDKVMDELDAWEKRALAAERERDELRAAFRDELDNWNPDARPTITAERDAALALAEHYRDALKFYAKEYGLGARLASDGGMRARQALALDTGDGRSVDVKQMGEVEDVSWAAKLNRKMLPGGSGEEAGGE